MSDLNPTLNAKIDEQRIRERAYMLWKKANYPKGQADEFWNSARQELSMQKLGYDETPKESFRTSDPPANTAQLRARRVVAAKPCPQLPALSSRDATPKPLVRQIVNMADSST